ncbi:helix-turn-helix transcriptional regulator [Propionivibrio sp.]|uniref:helix-turn-helix transcriptional regulator n=1 Tax=Propionivibrio sp. TaxID=2212460 RepID=UPI003BF1059A
MPTGKTHNSLARQWELLRRLPPRGPGKTAKQLADELKDAGFAVTKRTVERDLANLYDAFDLVCNNAGVPFGWHWISGACPEMPGLTLAEALSLRLLENYLKPLLPVSILSVLAPRFNSAAKKLDVMAEENAMARWTDKVRAVSPSLPFLPPKIADGVLETVQEAVLLERQLDVDYQAFNAPEATEQQLHPLAIVQRGPVTYLVATAFDYDDIRLYAAHRILAAKVSEEPAKRSKDFDLDAYIAQGALQFGKGETVRLEAHVSEGLACVLRETPISEVMTLEPEGSEWRLVATLADSWQLQWWVLSQGSGITVISPEGLRNAIAEELAQALAGYKEGTNE